MIMRMNTLKGYIKNKTYTVHSIKLVKLHLENVTGGNAYIQLSGGFTHNALARSAIPILYKPFESVIISNVPQVIW